MEKSNNTLTSGKIHGYEIRKPYVEENVYFKKNKDVAGMATEDNKIILNPYSSLNEKQLQVVAENEAIRLFLKDKKIEPMFNVTPEQQASFANTEYGKPENLLNLKHTLISRILTGDTSAGQVTDMQQTWANFVKEELSKKNE